MLSRFLTALLLLTAISSVHAGLVLRGARVIYEEAQGEATVHLRSTAGVPIVMQVWLDTGEVREQPGSEDVPFILTPAVTRVEPGNAQSVRVLRVRDNLPKDRESLLYFNTLEVPPMPVEQIANGDNFLRFSVHGRFKFFYRPKGLPFGPERALGALRFSLDTSRDDGVVRMRIYNPSPYHVTFSNLALHRAGDAESAPALLEFNHESMLERMVPPMGELTMPLEWKALPPGVQMPAGLEIRYSTINDAGGIEPGRRRIG